MNVGTESAVTSDMESAVAFDFTHKGFTLSAVHFTHDAESTGALMNITLDGLCGTLPVRSLYQAFGIDPASEDGKLMALLPKALRYVKQICPGDSIPTEVLDGRASWLVDPRYRDIANARMTLSLVAWYQGQLLNVQGGQQLLDMAATERTKNIYPVALSKVTDKLGYKNTEQSRVSGMLEWLATEFPYIEALRERLFQRICRMLAVLHTLEGVYKRDCNALEELERIRTLLQAPTRKLDTRFDEVDAVVGEMLPALRDLPNRITYIRKARDEFRTTYLLWEEMLTLWQDVEPERSPDIEVMIKRTYRFAARHYTQSAQWALSSR